MNIGHGFVAIATDKDNIISFIVGDRGSKYLVKVKRNAAARCVQRDDSLRWKNDRVFWTPKMRYWYDYELEFISAKEIIEEKKVDGKK